MRRSLILPAIIFSISCFFSASGQSVNRALFTSHWKFHLDSVASYESVNIDDQHWRDLNLPHDWSIEGAFSKDNPSTPSGGALPGGVGWYRKSFTLPASEKGKIVFIDFDGVYCNSTVWINGHQLGFRPNGYISFRYDLTPYLNYGEKKNVVAVKVDNSKQPNSRWYSGSGIYRNVWLIKEAPLHVAQWGTYITTPFTAARGSRVRIETKLENLYSTQKAFELITTLKDAAGNTVASTKTNMDAGAQQTVSVGQDVRVDQAHLWSIDDPYMYQAITQVKMEGKIVDTYETPFGIRSFYFDVNKGFLLNGKHIKINGVCNHHDLGALGTAINTRALERQLQILKSMGCNAVRTSHNPPAPELLMLADRMGFLIMDEAFDMWKLPKNPYDYHLYWDQWHAKDLQDQVLRDRNHPSVILWSIGNEINEQWNVKDSSGRRIAKELGEIIRSLDTTRPITDANNNPVADNPIILSGGVDIIGYNYSQNAYPDFHKRFPGQKFIATETVSALETRGHYDMPSDSIRRWPVSWDKPFTTGNADLTCSAYDNVSAPWGSTHEETWKIIKKYDFLSGQFIWTGFDYLGEPTPYPWPARSSYFGIVDLAGFPKDVYYMYQSEWTNKPVLHVFPHWNWKPGQTVDIWAYYNQADEVELFLNGKSVGTRRKKGDDLHVMWRLSFEPGTLKAVSRKNGKVVLTQEIRTAGAPVKVLLKADRAKIKADGRDLSYITVSVVDRNGIVVPDADNNIHFSIKGKGILAGLDNGSETDLESFKSDNHKAFNGLALAIIQSNGEKGAITLTATADGLQTAELKIEAN